MALYSTYTDEELVALLQQDDHKAFREIYDRYWDKLLYLSGKKLPHIEDAENIVQDIFTDIWQRRHSLSIQQKLGGYLVVAVKYRIINMLAQARKWQEHQAGLPLKALSNLSPEQYMEEKERQKWLVELTDQLPEKCQLAFRLRHQGFSYREIAQQMQVNEKTVEKHIGKALRTFRTRFGQFWNLFLLVILFRTW